MTERDDQGGRGRVVPPRAWLARPVLDVAPDLLGAFVTASSPAGDVTVRLTEVEAYAGESDPGSHAYRGPSPRNAVMFGAAGHLYVYRHMGLHHCVNVVTGTEGTAAAVLLRAGEVVGGVELARDRRTARGVVRRDVDLAAGPARLTTCLGLDLSSYGVDLLDPRSPVRLELLRSAGGRGAGAAHLGTHRDDTPLVLTGPRVGVAGDGGDATAHPWRFWLADEPTVSKYRAAPPRRPRGARPRSGGTAD